MTVSRCNCTIGEFLECSGQSLFAINVNKPRNCMFAVARFIGND